MTGGCMPLAAAVCFLNRIFWKRRAHVFMGHFTLSQGAVKMTRFKCCFCKIQEVKSGEWRSQIVQVDPMLFGHINTCLDAVRMEDNKVRGLRFLYWQFPALWWFGKDGSIQEDSQLWMINSEGTFLSRGPLLCWSKRCVVSGLWNSDHDFHFVSHWRLWKFSWKLSRDGTDTSWRRTERQNQPLFPKIDDAVKPTRLK